MDNITDHQMRYNPATDTWQGVDHAGRALEVSAAEMAARFNQQYSVHARHPNAPSAARHGYPPQTAAAISALSTGQWPADQYAPAPFVPYQGGDE